MSNTIPFPFIAFGIVTGVWLLFLAIAWVGWIRREGYEGTDDE